LDSIAVNDREAVFQNGDYKALRLDLADVANPTAIRDALATASARLEESRHARNASIESTAPDS